MTQLLDHLEDVGEGWRPILVALHADLLVIQPEYYVGQVKEKFGGLRVYLDSGYTPETEAAIDKATALASITCEWCGEPGSLRNNYYWLLTLCDACAQKRKEERDRWRAEQEQSS